MQPGPSLLPRAPKSKPASPGLMKAGIIEIVAFGNLAIMPPEGGLRPMALRPHLSMGLPLSLRWDLVFYQFCSYDNT
jgi:hypothetical protein